MLLASFKFGDVSLSSGMARSFYIYARKINLVGHSLMRKIVASYT